MLISRILGRSYGITYSRLRWFWIPIKTISGPGFYTSVLGTSGTWQVALVKFTCHPRLRPLFKSLYNWQLVKSTWKVTPQKLHAQADWRTPARVLGGGARSRSRPKKRSKLITFWLICPILFRCIDFPGIILRCSLQRESDYDLALLLRRWWFLRNNL